MYTAGSGEGIQPDSSVLEEYARPPTCRRPNSSPRPDDRLADGLAVVPGPEQLPPGLAGHAVAQGANRLPGDRDRGHVEEPELRGGPAEQLLDHGHRVRALHLEAVGLAAPVGAERAALVERDAHVVAARLGVVGDPVQRGGAADEVVPVLGQEEEDHVADHVAVGRAGHEVLRPVHGEPVEAVHGQAGEQRRRVRALDREVGHVVRLVEEDAGLLPGRLLVAPVRELGRDARIDVRPRLRVAEQLDGARRRRRAGLPGCDCSRSCSSQVVSSAAAPPTCSPR